MRDRTDYLLWGLSTAALAVPVIALDDARDARGSFARRVAALVWPIEPFDRFVISLTDIAVGSALVALAWLTQYLAVRRGFRLIRRPDRAHAADYDDTPISPSTR